ncbi:MAG: hypothetical protein P8104_07105, partial [Gammaproteobacteria bacterium]
NGNLNGNGRKGRNELTLSRATAYGGTVDVVMLWCLLDFWLRFFGTTEGGRCHGECSVCCGVGSVCRRVP